MQLQTFLGIIDATHNLTLATVNATANNPALAGPTLVTVGPEGTGLRGRTGGSPGGLGGGGPRGPGRPPPWGPPPQFEAFGCSADGFTMTGKLNKQGFHAAVSMAGYDQGLFSFVGCRCDPGYDNIYLIGETGVLADSVSKVNSS